VPSPTTSAHPSGATGQGGGRAATAAVAILTVMNLLNYVDRFVPSAVKDLFKRDLHLSDTQTSLPLSAFVIIYMLASPVFGALADRLPRRQLIAAGVALWSLATAAAALSNSFWHFLLARAAVGIGEAAYATLAPSLISDLYPPWRRNRVLTVFYVAIPVGSAIGFVAGGALGAHFGWRAAFLICGLPGVLAAAAVLLIREPPRGQFDAPSSAPAALSWPIALEKLRRNRLYVQTVMGYVAVTFASGALADWLPTYLHRHRGWGLQDASGLVGMTAVVGGLAGTAAGGFLGDFLRGRIRLPLLGVSALSMVAATGFAVPALLAHDHLVIVVCMFLAQFFLWFYNGPVNAILVNCTSPELRARAFSLSILSIHLFGDAVSPTIVGAVSDAANLPLAMALVPTMFGVGALVWFFGWRRLDDRETA
jgi:MFS family permease